MIRFETSRLILRSLERVDAESMVPYFSDAESCRFIPWEPRQLRGVLEFLDKWSGGNLPQNSGEALILGAELPGVGVIGQLNVTLESTQHKHAEFGYIFNPKFTGQGFAGEAVFGLVTWLFENLDLHRVTAYVDERNSSSVKLLEKLGFRLEARFVENEFFKGKWVTMLTFAMLKSAWPKP